MPSYDRALWALRTWLDWARMSASVWSARAPRTASA